MDNEIRAAFDSISKQLEQIHEKLGWVDWTLNILRAQPEQDKLQLAFEATKNLTLKEVRSWKKDERIVLIREDADHWLPYRCLSYKHDHLDEEVSALATLRRAHGVRHLGRKEQERKLEKINLAAGHTNQEARPELEESEQWSPYEFLVGEEESYDDEQGFSTVKELDMTDATLRKLISDVSERASRRGDDM